MHAAVERRQAYLAAKQQGLPGTTMHFCLLSLAKNMMAFLNAWRVCHMYALQETPGSQF